MNNVVAGRMTVLIGALVALATTACGTGGGHVAGGDCTEGMTIVMGHCCWPGQSWSDGVGQCIGHPTSCPPGRSIGPSGCEPGGVGTVAGGPALPPGTRVKRGPDWKWEDQDQHGFGTVIRQSDSDEQWLVVRWDHGASEAYRYGDEGAFDLEVAPNAPPPPIGPGWRVHPAPSAGLDETLTGELVSAPESGWVDVKWPSGETKKMRLGAEGAWDLVPIGPALPPIAVGDRVRRGPDWRWGDQDQNGMGTVVSLDPQDPWVSVWWDHGDDNNYRWGQDDSFDLEIMPGAGFPPIAKGWRVKAGPHAPDDIRSAELLGVVVADADDTGRVRVRWDNGREMLADTGAAGKVEVLPLRGLGRPIALGDRVKRGKTWAAGSEDQGGLGTVIRTPFKEQMVGVRWDSGNAGEYRWGREGAFDVDVVPQAAPLVIAKGTAVVPGPLCVVLCLGRSEGNVVATAPKGQVKVKWADRDEVAVLPVGIWGVMPAHGVDTRSLKVGDRIRRGPDWRWEDQDGDQPGIVIQLNPDDEQGWVRVRWDHGGENNYRWGADEAYDLEKILTPN